MEGNALTIRQPCCTACKRPLKGKIFAAGCGHLFHADCTFCPICNLETHADGKLLEVFGAEFSTGRHQVVAPLKRSLVERRELLTAAKEQLKGVSMERDRQLKKLQDAQACQSKQESELASLQERVDAGREDIATLTLQVQELRECSTVEQYHELLEKNGAQEALQFLQKRVPFALEPAVTLAHVRRLRDRYKERVVGLQREAANLYKDEKQKKKQLNELRAKVCSEQSKLSGAKRLRHEGH
mmetsp:Transcript_47054/g.105561  ORF Transcript_47054/g.105561 Transcript_47054/m.105561 type:complete len:242 (-) Transcript_47054:32-757(-)